MKKLAALIAVAGLMGTPAIAADMGLTPRPLPAPSQSWTGVYGGVNAGWNVTTASTATQVNTPQTDALFAESVKGSGAIGGVQFGYNWQATSNWIAGIEADFQYTGANATGTAQQLRLNPGLLGAVITESFARTDSLDWFGTARGRIGYAVPQGFMFYATGGFAYGRVTESTSALFTDTLITFPPVVSNANASFGVSTVRTGWTAGGGVESAIAPGTHLSWKFEYLYVDLGRNNAAFAGNAFGTPVTNTTSSALADHIVRFGLNWHPN